MSQFPWGLNDPDEAYDLDDPKHSTFHERYAEKADMDRKRLKEDAMEAAERPVVGEGRDG